LLEAVAFSQAKASPYPFAGRQEPVASDRPGTTREKSCHIIGFTHNLDADGFERLRQARATIKPDLILADLNEGRRKAGKLGEVRRGFRVARIAAAQIKRPALLPRLAPVSAVPARPP